MSPNRFPRRGKAHCRAGRRVGVSSAAIHPPSPEASPPSVGASSSICRSAGKQLLTGRRPTVSFAHARRSARLGQADSRHGCCCFWSVPLQRPVRKSFTLALNVCFYRQHHCCLCCSLYFFRVYQTFRQSHTRSAHARSGLSHSPKSHETRAKENAA